ncbi:MAG: DUF2203 domain-containing protein [Candidatus Marinimicrobia bacterium]|nr:DUF2203 domain-containing protein [Candidatus Neomarinimicrobiota bacterium]
MSRSGDDKLFTVNDASKLLPQLSTIIDEFRDRRDTFFKLNRELNELREVVGNEAYRSEELSNKERILVATSKELENLLDEVSKQGCMLKDVEHGLVDFISIFRGKKVFLCWQQGEEEISWYHDIQSGFTGRKKISDPDEFKDTLS